ncbi:putative O-methyltransferase YrrM [Flavobacteriaceae bacterium MAR_2010_72]|nr:putative O-methyltransferase YrrM [Flavobacteriaceae bacterium MAR_2010_72]
MYQSIQYIKFLLTSTNQHGVHSPFVYDLVTNCFYDKTQYSAYDTLKAYRKTLLEQPDSVQVKDFGAGSKRFKSNQRQVSRIAKTSGSSFKRAKLLFRLSQYLKPKYSLELGTSLGIGTQALALGNPEGQVTSIEGSPEIANQAAQHLESFGIKNINLKLGSFGEVLPNLEPLPWDLIFIDGHHQKEATLQYFETLLTSVHNDTMMIFDDIYWSKGMTQAWELIKNHPKVSVTIDTFFWGLVFFRKEQLKENFKIRL